MESINQVISYYSFIVTASNSHVATNWIDVQKLRTDDHSKVTQLLYCALPKMFKTEGRFTLTQSSLLQIRASVNYETKREPTADLFSSSAEGDPYIL